MYPEHDKQLELQALVAQFEDRRVYNSDGIVSNAWAIMTIKPYDTEVLKNIINMTTGKVYLGTRCVAFEDARDATAFKLVN